MKPLNKLILAILVLIVVVTAAVTIAVYPKAKRKYLLTVTVYPGWPAEYERPLVKICATESRCGDTCVWYGFTTNGTVCLILPEGSYTIQVSYDCVKVFLNRNMTVTIDG